jgi:hypothetical protein
MARSTFGGTNHDGVYSVFRGLGRPLLALTTATLTFWDAKTGGVRHTALLDENGTPTAAIATDSDGQVPTFQGPDGVTALWADDGDGTRHLMLATDTQTIAAAKDAAVQAKIDAEAAAASVAREQADGVAGLDAAGKLFLSRIPDGVVQAGDLAVNAADYGLSTAATAAANTTALNDANAATNAKGANAELLIPPGVFDIDGKVQITCHLHGEQATLRYTGGAGTALVIGDESASGLVTARKRFSLPRVVQPTQDWTTVVTGVRLVNLNACDLYIPFVQNFERGLVVYGFGQGTAYCTITLGALWQNHKQLILDADSTGWSNQNTYFGGRLQQTISGGAVDEDTAAHQILIGETAGASPNQNTFIGTSIEGDNPAYYRLDCNGRYNHFVNCRWEALGGQSRVRWGADASGNVIDHGYEAHLLVETVVAGSFANEIRTRDGSYVKASTSAGMTIPNNLYTTITGWTNDSKHAPYTTANGAWTPRQGRWRITATVTFLANSTGQRAARLLVGGTTTLDAGQLAGSSIQQSLKLQANHRFDGATSLVVQAYQNSGADLGLSTSAGFVTMHAEWVGP